MTSKVAGTTVIVAGVLSNFAIRSLMSIVVTHIMVAHVSLVVHHSCASRRIVLCNRSQCGLVHVGIV